LISGPPPCTSTGRMPTQDSSTRSVMTPACDDRQAAVGWPCLDTLLLGLRPWNGRLHFSVLWERACNRYAARRVLMGIGGLQQGAILVSLP
jgi:hypothetical protein